jgi:hypothetical protein
MMDAYCMRAASVVVEVVAVQGYTPVVAEIELVVVISAVLAVRPLSIREKTLLA